MNKNDKTKRRINYIGSEDFYFMAYQLIIVLDEITSNNSVFKDHRKLAYLMHLSSKPEFVSILQRYKDRKIVNAEDKEVLFSSFTAGELHKREVYKLLLSLEKNGLLEVFRGSEPEVFNVRLNRESIPVSFLSSDNFNAERRHITILKSVVGRLSSLTLDTFLEKMYRNYGVKVWAL